MIKEDINFDIKTVILEKIRISVGMRFTNQMLRNMMVDQFKDTIADNVEYKFNSFILGILDEEIVIDISYPENWYQAIRERFFPKKWIQKYPIKKTTIYRKYKTYAAICPHLDTNEPRNHVQWLASFQ